MHFWQNSMAEDKVGALFQPDTLLPTQYYETLHNKTSLLPEKRLMLAILEDALGCFKNSMFAQGRRQLTHFRDANGWIVGENSDSLFSFENVCETLGIEPTYLRQKLFRWKKEQLNGGQKAKGSTGVGNSIS